MNLVNPVPAGVVFPAPAPATAPAAAATAAVPVPAVGDTACSLSCADSDARNSVALTSPNKRGAPVLREGGLLLLLLLLEMTGGEPFTGTRLAEEPVEGEEEEAKEEEDEEEAVDLTLAVLAACKEEEEKEEEEDDDGTPFAAMNAPCRRAKLRGDGGDGG